MLPAGVHYAAGVCVGSGSLTSEGFFLPHKLEPCSSARLMERDAAVAARMSGVKIAENDGIV